ncbi:hypothetical protein NL676_004571 [Syzygium grande]|nr:hypothetical protein NL676_004571 [Syzygium grande]
MAARSKLARPSPPTPCPSDSPGGGGGARRRRRPVDFTVRSAITVKRMQRSPQHIFNGSTKHQRRIGITFDHGGRE